VTAWILRLGVGLAISLVVSEVTYRLVEQPGIALGRRWIEQLGWGRTRPQSEASFAPSQRLSS